MSLPWGGVVVPPQVQPPTAADPWEVPGPGPWGLGPRPPAGADPRPRPAPEDPAGGAGPMPAGNPPAGSSSGMRAPYPPRLPVPSGFAASGGGLRGPGPGCGPRLPGPGLAFGGPGCGSLAPGRCAALALAIARGPARRPGCGSPPGAPAAAGACPGPGGLRPPGPRPPGRGSCRPPSAPLRAPLRGWGALGLLRAAVAPLPSRPGSPLPCPRPFGPGVGPSGPPGLLRPGGGWAALRAAWISRRPPGWRETGEGGAAAAALSWSVSAFAASGRLQAPPAAPWA